MEEEKDNNKLLLELMKDISDHQVDSLLGDPTKAKMKLGWETSTSLKNNFRNDRS